MFENLCIQHKISTNELQIVSAVLSLDSKFALCIVQDVSDPENDRFVLQAFDVETIHKSPSWSIEYNGKNMTMKRGSRQSWKQWESATVGVLELQLE